MDIPSGRVLLDNLAGYYARQAMGEGRPGPVWHDNPALKRPPGGRPGPVPAPQALYQRVCDYSQGRRRSGAPWDERSLYRLAVLAGKKRPYARISSELGRTVRSCRAMYSVLKKAGIV